MDKNSFSAHPSALVETEEVGADTRVWAYAHILDGARIGADCNIGDHCFVEGGASIGDHVVIKNGVSLWSGLTLEDWVFVGPNAVFTNDRMPRAKVFHAEPEQTFVREGASIGAGATILCGLALGRWCMVGAGSLVLENVPDFALVYGAPARQRGWVCACGEKLPGAFRSDLEQECLCGRRYHFIEGRLKEAEPIQPPGLSRIPS